MSWPALDDAIEALDLEAWLEGYATLKGSGDERQIETCPECGDTRYKLYVNVEKKRWLCQHCDWGRGKGDVVELMAAVSDRHETSIRIELLSTAIPAIQGDPGLTQALNEIFSAPTLDVEMQTVTDVELPGVQSFAGITSQQVLAYATFRGLTDIDVQRMQLRSAYKLPGRRRPVRGPWLVFPVRVANRNVAWQGRKVVSGDPKYLSSANIHDWLWPLDDLFFKVYKPGAPIALVEGVFDAWGMLRYNIAALCTFGKTISDTQIALLKEIRPGELMFMWDADASKDYLRAVQRVSYNFPVVTVVNLVDPAVHKKIDAGDALQRPAEVVPWLASKMKARINVKSQEFFQWQTSLLLQ